MSVLQSYIVSKRLDFNELMHEGLEQDDIH